MPLPSRELLAMLRPPAAVYRRGIAAEARSGEPGLAGLATRRRRGVTRGVSGTNPDVFAAIGRVGPAVVLALWAGTHQDPGAYTAELCDRFGCEAVIVQRGEHIPALPTIAALGKNASWGSEIESRNVLFLPR